MDTWDDKQTGQKRSKLYVVADGWEFVGAGGPREPGGGGGGAPAEGGEALESSPAAVDETPF
jgi:single-strand DNA-binding protein